MAAWLGAWIVVPAVLCDTLWLHGFKTFQIFNHDRRDLEEDLVQLFNKMKTENYIPEFIQNADITTIYKGKGEKNNFERLALNFV